MGSKNEKCNDGGCKIFDKRNSRSQDCLHSISILVTDYDSLEFESWFGKSVQKICSVSASIATMAFNKSMVESSGKNGAIFDSRCYVVPKEDVCNYFIWRQQDAVRNSIQGCAHKYFSNKEIHKKNTGQLQEMLFSIHKINWNDFDIWKKRGWTVKKFQTQTHVENQEVIRTIIKPDWNIPIFTKDRKYIDDLVLLPPRE